MADIYFWLMTEILFFYCLTVFIVCYFFRRFCQDPMLKKKLADEEAAEELEEAEKLELSTNDAESNKEALLPTNTKVKKDLETAGGPVKKSAAPISKK